MTIKVYKTASIRKKSYDLIEHYREWSYKEGEEGFTEAQNAKKCEQLLYKNNNRGGLTLREWQEFKRLEKYFYSQQLDYLATIG